MTIITLAPQPLEAIEPIARPHLDRFATVLLEAWDAFAQLRAAKASTMLQAGASARGMLVSDLTRLPAHRAFKGVSGVSVDDRFGRPWVCLDGGRVQVRFRKLSSALALCHSDSDRATRLDFHLGDPAAPRLTGLDAEATVLTAGYVLDAGDLGVERLALVCHIGTILHYWLPLVGGSASAPAPEQLTVAPLTEPIIRSARTAAADRIQQQKEGEQA